MAEIFTIFRIINPIFVQIQKQNVNYISTVRHKGEEAPFESHKNGRAKMKTRGICFVMFPTVSFAISASMEFEKKEIELSSLQSESRKAIERSNFALGKLK